MFAMDETLIEGGEDPAVEEGDDFPASQEPEKPITFRVRPLGAPESVTPNPRKFGLFILLAIIFAAIVLALQIVPPQSYPSQQDVATKTREGIMYAMGNVSQPTCSIYDYSCEQYLARYPAGTTLYGETRAQIRSVVERLSLSIPGKVATGPLSSAGIYGCFSVKVTADYQNRVRAALYLSQEGQSSDDVRVVLDLPDEVPNDVRNVYERAVTAGVRVYWMYTGQTIEEWSIACTNGTARGLAAYEAIVSQEDTDLLLRYYDLDACCGYAMANKDSADLEALVGVVRRRTLEYIDTARWMAPATRMVFTQKVVGLQIYTGGTAAECDLSADLYECLVRTHAAELSALNVYVKGSDYWPVNSFDTAVTFDPYYDAIYVPWGAAQEPMYSPAWSNMYKLATLGAVIAAEIGNYLTPSPVNNITLTSDISDTRECVGAEYWSTFWSASTVSLPTPTFYVLWSQTLCGNRAIVNSTLGAFYPFSVVMECPQPDSCAV